MGVDCGDLGDGCGVGRVCGCVVVLGAYEQYEGCEEDTVKDRAGVGEGTSNTTHLCMALSVLAEM